MNKIKVKKMNSYAFYFILVLSLNFFSSCTILQGNQDIKLVRTPNTLELQVNNQKIELLNLPDVRQSRTYTCGPSSIQAILMYYGLEKREDILAYYCQTTEEGTIPQNLLNGVRMLGFTGKMKQRLQIKDLQFYINQKMPVLVAIQAYRSDERIAWEDCWDDGHYVVVIGYDQNNIYFEDPSLLGSVGYIQKQEFIIRWHDIDSNNRIYYGLGILIEGKRESIAPLLKIL